VGFAMLALQAFDFLSYRHTLFWPPTEALVQVLASEMPLQKFVKYVYSSSGVIVEVGATVGASVFGGWALAMHPVFLVNLQR
jgi:hypothetical protein